MTKEPGICLISGLTALELLMSLAIATVVITLGAPALQNVSLNATRSATVNAFVRDVQFARGEAQLRLTPVILCQSYDGQTCGQVPQDYSSGWIVFADLIDTLPTQRNPADPLLRAANPTFSGEMTANRAAFEFRPFPRRSTNGTVRFCDTRGWHASRQIVISYTGRPRVELLQQPQLDQCQI